MTYIMLTMTQEFNAKVEYVNLCSFSVSMSCFYEVVASKYLAKHLQDNLHKIIAKKHVTTQCYFKKYLE